MIPAMSTTVESESSFGEVPLICLLSGSLLLAFYAYASLGLLAAGWL